MPIPCFSKIRLLTNAYEGQGVSVGDVGVIIEVHSNEAYEVEFSRDDGTTIAWFAVKEYEIEVIGKDELDKEVKKI